MIISITVIGIIIFLLLNPQYNDLAIKIVLIIVAISIFRGVFWLVNNVFTLLLIVLVGLLIFNYFTGSNEFLRLIGFLKI